LRVLTHLDTHAEDKIIFKAMSIIFSTHSVVGRVPRRCADVLEKRTKSFSRQCKYFFLCTEMWGVYREGVQMCRRKRLSTKGFTRQHKYFVLCTNILFYAQIFCSMHSAPRRCADVPQKKDFVVPNILNLSMLACRYLYASMCVCKTT